MKAYPYKNESCARLLLLSSIIRTLEATVGLGRAAAPTILGTELGDARGFSEERCRSG
jgi:hypothetical protein